LSHFPKVCLKDHLAEAVTDFLRRLAAALNLGRFPIRWNHLIGKETLRFKELEHVLIEKAGRLFGNVL